MVYRRARGGVPSKTTFLPIDNKVAKKVPVETFFDTIFPSYTPAERIHLSHYVTAPQGASRADFWHKTNGYRNGAKTYVCTEYASHLVVVCS